MAEHTGDEPPSTPQPPSLGHFIAAIPGCALSLRMKMRAPSSLSLHSLRAIAVQSRRAAPFAAVGRQRQNASIVGGVSDPLQPNRLWPQGQSPGGRSRPCQCRRPATVACSAISRRREHSESLTPGRSRPSRGQFSSCARRRQGSSLRSARAPRWTRPSGFDDACAQLTTGNCAMARVGRKSSRTNRRQDLTGWRVLHGRGFPESSRHGSGAVRRTHRGGDSPGCPERNQRNERRLERSRCWHIAHLNSISTL